jgi:N-acyl-D-aspartate/D-glutamate deacylase
VGLGLRIHVVSFRASTVERQRNLSHLVGRVTNGAIADLVLFNPATVIDRSTFSNPFALPIGIEKVFVNGTLVWSSDKPTGARPGGS